MRAHRVEVVGCVQRSFCTMSHHLSPPPHRPSPRHAHLPLSPLSHGDFRPVAKCQFLDDQGTLAAFREIWQQVYGYAQVAGKAPDTLDAGKLMYISVGTDRARCGAQLRAFTLAYHGPPCDVGANCVFGPSDIRRDEPGLPRRRGAYRYARANLPRRGAGQAYAPRGDAVLTVRQGHERRSWEPSQSNAGGGIIRPGTSERSI
jgi:hypothetical protein